MALVREKPLEWVWESDTWIARNDRGAYCVWDGPSGVRCSGPDNVPIPATDTADGKRICESKWHETWLRDTYVPPLVWVDDKTIWNGETSGPFSCWCDGGSWYADYLTQSGRDEWISDPCETREAAVEQANHHNRRLVIGE